MLVKISDYSGYRTEELWDQGHVGKITWRIVVVLSTRIALSVEMFFQLLDFQTL